MAITFPAPPPRAQRLVYLGSPELAVAPLRALVDAGYDIALVVSRPDKRRGRGATPTPSPVKAAAMALGLAVSDDVNDTARVGADLAVVVAYGRLIKADLLAQIPFVNLHFSLLPRWRGAAPVERALLAGDTTTGVCVMAMEEGLDTGGVYRRAELQIEPDDTLDTLRTRLVEAGTELLLDCLSQGFGSAQPQSGEALYAPKIDPTELQLDWSEPAVLSARKVHIGRAWTTLRDRRLLVHDARAVPAGEPGPALAPGEIAVQGQAVLVGTGDGLLELVTVQPEGRARQDAAAWRNGARPTAADRLGR